MRRKALLPPIYPESEVGRYVCMMTDDNEDASFLLKPILSLGLFYIYIITGLFRHFTSSFSSWVESHEDLLQHIIPESRELAFRMLQRFHLMFFFFTNR